MTSTKRPTIGLKEIGEDFRAHGVGIAQNILYDMAREKKWPWITDVRIGPNGRAYILIWRKDYEDWAKEYLDPYGPGEEVKEG